MTGRPCPIFLFSIPRSGSTVVQRVLAYHDDISTRSEPWLLIPHMYALRERGVSADYTHPLLARALNDFVPSLPQGYDDYYREVREFALNLYAKASDENTRYFLDKSPPYYLVVEDIIRAFPDAKFVFLWRNPLSVVASWVETFMGNRWKLESESMRADLFIGLQNLTAAYSQHSQHVVAVRYEELMTSEEPWRRLLDYLEIEFDASSLKRFGEVKLHGTLGDPTGTKMYSEISADPIAKWKQTVGNPLRRMWCRRYLLWIGAERLEIMGYDLAALLAELEGIPLGSENLVRDSLHLGGRLLREPVRARARRIFGLSGPSVIRLLLSPAEDVRAGK